MAILSVMVAALLGAGLAGPTTQASAAPKSLFQFSSPSPAATVGEGDDFFTNVLHDPEDFNNPEDMTDPNGWSSLTVANGVLSGQTNAGDANFFLLHPGFDIAAVGVDSRSGQVYQIDPNHYSHLVFKYTASAATNAVAYWMPPGNPYSHGFGNSDIVGIPAGTHIVDMDLNRRAGNGGAGLTWNSAIWGGFRFQPAFATPGVSIQIDWIRLVPDNAAPTLHTTWTCPSCNGSAQMFASPDTNSSNLISLVDSVNVAAGQFDIPTGKLAPGQYYIAARTSDGAIAFSANKFTVQASPMIKITSPSTTSGQNFATTMLGKPWDLTDPSMYQPINIANFSVANGIGQGNAINGDPAVYLLNSNAGLGNSTINTALYKYMTFDIFIPRPGNSVFNVARVLWYNTPTAANTTGDLINWHNYWTHYSLDMSQVKLASNAGGGWTGNQSTLRIDPHEWDEPNPLPAYFMMRGVSLTADPTVKQNSSTAIRWNTTRGSGTVSLYYDRQKNSTGGTQIASNVSLSDGVYNWNVGNIATGSYWIRAVATDGFSTTQWYSDAPVVIAPQGVVGVPVLSEPNGLGDVTNEGDDFFTAQLHDAEDFRNPEDVSSANGFSSQGMSNGEWTGVTRAGDANFFLLNPGLDNTPLSGRGQSAQIDPTRYSHLVFRYTASVATFAIVYWMPAGSPYVHGFGNSDIVPLQQGTHIIDIDLNQRTGAAAGLTWASGRWGGLRFSPAFGTVGTQIKLDWVRLTPASGGSTVHVNWSCQSCLSNAFDIYADDDNNPDNGGMLKLMSSVNPGTTQFDVPISKLNPGTYYFAAVSSGNPTMYSAGKFIVLSANGYVDVDASNPFASYINQLATRGIVEGFNDNTFRPYDNATRATLARWIVKARGWSYNTTGGPHFTDVPTTNPDYAYIETAYNHGVLSGYDDHTFRPDASLTRGQMSKMVVNALSWTTTASNTQNFVDVSSSNPFYAQIETIFERGLISGYDAPGGGREFRWGNTLTRSQLAKVLANALTQ